ncbi:hypothetical protein BRAS3843_140004 [Bradyrhizobium sp. STM 3843]|nr:hypothetical protein BRAS3843_140004 [Bradyrhizobium sp. STM 3843]
MPKFVSSEVKKTEREHRYAAQSESEGPANMISAPAQGPKAKLERELARTRSPLTSPEKGDVRPSQRSPRGIQGRYWAT